MPVSIWNDQVYDNSAIYTGSGTVVDGKVVQVYPGLCNTKEAGCPGGTNLCIAVPADPSDPLQTNWTKTWAQNPIVPNTGRDPSTAWKTSSGEWRLTTFDTMTFGSMDFKTWYRIGKTPGFAGGECPSFFPLPKTTPGAKVSASDPTPTHVHKASHGGDWMCVGTYIEGPAKTTGNFTATPGIAAGLKETKIDAGQFYASKDFYDPVKQRRINWGWATTAGPTQVQTLPREITWHPELQQLVYTQVEEQDSLRVNKIGGFSGTLTAGTPSSLGLPKSVGSQSEIMVSFSRPNVDATLGVKVMVSGTAGTLFTVDYHKLSNTASVGGGGKSDTLKLLDADKTIHMRLYIDNTFAEVYYQGGRVAMTVNTPASDDADVTLSSSVAGITASATAWSVSSIWVTPEEVLRTPRLDGKPLDAWKEIVRHVGTPEWQQHIEYI
jgi:sucrose-6-phosphate hydrolase SacC (GH32 family)